MATECAQQLPAHDVPGADGVVMGAGDQAEPVFGNSYAPHNIAVACKTEDYRTNVGVRQRRSKEDVWTWVVFGSLILTNSAL